MVKTRNNDIREAVKEAGLFLWQIADALGITDAYFSKLLRKELPQEKKATIFQIIKELKEGEAQ
ncbi:MAG: hypothetical protein H5U02_10100 [Clostridia bacterium]|nr:hypothetical protein [Clostridia bacterium]